MVDMFDALEITQALQEAARLHDRECLEGAVSDRMIWVMPLSDNQRVKRDWIDASCAVAWNWFEIVIRRELDIGDARVVESWIKQSRDPVTGEDESRPVTAAAVVLDVWARECGTWRLVSRQPQRSEDLAHRPGCLTTDTTRLRLLVSLKIGRASCRERV
jgi:hypothetical protein